MMGDALKLHLSEDVAFVLRGVPRDRWPIKERLYYATERTRRCDAAELGDQVYHSHQRLEDKNR